MRQKESASSDPMSENADGEENSLTAKLNQMWNNFLSS